MSLYAQSFKMVSLSISDGSSPGEAFNRKFSLFNSSRWFPAFPSPEVSILGMEERGLWGFESKTPIALAMFKDSSRERRNISNVTSRSRDEGCIFYVEVRYLDETDPVRIGLDNVKQGEITSFTMVYKNGEDIRGLECFYEPEGALLGFKVLCFTHRLF